MSRAPAGPKLDGGMNLLRALLADWWDIENHRPRAAAFAFSLFSVNVHRSTDSVRWFARKLPNTVEVASFGVSAACELGYDCRDEIDEQFPENLDHAHVYNPNPKSRRKTRAQELAMRCTIVEEFRKLKADRDRSP